MGGEKSNLRPLGTAWLDSASCLFVVFMELVLMIELLSTGVILATRYSLLF